MLALLVVLLAAGGPATPPPVPPAALVRPFATPEPTAPVQPAVGPVVLGEAEFELLALPANHTGAVSWYVFPAAGPAPVTVHPVARKQVIALPPGLPDLVDTDLSSLVVVGTRPGVRERKVYPTEGASLALVRPVKGARGRAVVAAFGVVDQVPTKLADLEVEVAGGGPRPDPAPTPGPTPGPGPQPDASRALWLVVLEESVDRTPEAAKVLLDKGLWDRLAARGHRQRVLDKDNPFAVQRGYPAAAQAAGVPLPALLLFDAARAAPADPVAVIPFPKTSAAVEAAVQKAGGK